MATTPVQTNSSTQLKQKDRVDILKNIMNAESIQSQFKNALQNNSGPFIASVIDLYNSDTKLQQCDPKQVVMEALKAAVLKLPINKALGYAFIIPYDISTQIEGRWQKVTTPAFQLGYKGIIQLAMRTAQYRYLNADVVYEGELGKKDKLTGTIDFAGEKTSDKVIGYFCHFELLNGFSKTLYMTVEEMAKHAKKYVPSLQGYEKATADNPAREKYSVEYLISLANAEENGKVGWLGNFTGQALKTTVRLLLGKYGYLSIEMQQAFAEDKDYDYEEAQQRKEQLKLAGANIIVPQDASFIDVSDAPPAGPEKQEEKIEQAPY